MNQPDNPQRDLLAGTISSDEATALLGIRKASLYAYVSRGLVRTVHDPDDHRRRRYLRADVLDLKRRSDARAGHGPVAGAAMHWGEPVLATAICRIDPGRGPRYRGRLALDLVGESFESVVARLWEAPDADGPWSTLDTRGEKAGGCRANAPGQWPLHAVRALAEWAVDVPERVLLSPTDLGQTVFRILLDSLGPRCPSDRVAVGLANVWRFPYMMGTYGGIWFLAGLRREA